MNYRKLGRTGLKVSEIGLGCEGLTAQEGALLVPLINAAEKLGINYIDLYTPDARMRTALGHTLQGRRDKFILQAHLCSVWKNGQYERTRKINEVKQSFEDLLTRLDTDHIEVGMIHYVDSIEDWEEVVHGEVLCYAQELKSAGSIGYISLSSHNPVVAKTAVASGLIDVLMFSVNPCYDLQPANEDVEQLWAADAYKNQLVNMDPDRQSLYELCHREGVAITVMKAFGGGDLLHEEISPAGKSLTVNQCIHYALTRPAVATVLSGARSVAELEQCVAYETATEQEKDYAAALSAFPKISWEGHCMYCGHCAPCPKGIDVATVTKFLNLAKVQGSVPETVREHYAVLSHTAGECIACSACEQRCPFHVAVVENMRLAAKIFGK